MLVHCLVCYLERQAQSDDSLTADDAISSKRDFVAWMSMKLYTLRITAT